MIKYLICIVNLLSPSFGSCSHSFVKFHFSWIRAGVHRAMVQSSDEQSEEMDADHVEIRQVIQVKTPYHTWHPETQTKRNKVFIKLSKFDRKFVHFALRAAMDNTKGLNAVF